MQVLVVLGLRAVQELDVLGRCAGLPSMFRDRCEPSVPLDGRGRSEGTASVLGDGHVCCAWLLTEWVGMPTPFSTTWKVDGLEL